MARITRRRFLTVAAAAAGVAGVGTTIRSLLGPECADGVDGLGNVARAVFRDCAGAARIGETGEARNAAGALGARAQRWSRLAQAGPTPELVRMVEADVRRDFAAGRVTTMDGWVLSNAELGLAHACACD